MPDAEHDEGREADESIGAALAEERGEALGVAVADIDRHGDGGDAEHRAADEEGEVEDAVGMRPPRAEGDRHRDPPGPTVSGRVSG